jgi:hypothetical protein
MTTQFIAEIRRAADDYKAHRYSTHNPGTPGECLYCLNLVSWLGERMHLVLRYFDEQLERRDPIIDAARLLVGSVSSELFHGNATVQELALNDALFDFEETDQ